MMRTMQWIFSIALIAATLVSAGCGKEKEEAQDSHQDHTEHSAGDGHDHSETDAHAEHNH